MRCLVSAFAIGNNGYIGTGNSSTGSYADLWQYNAVTDVWTQMANLPGVARTRGVAFAVNNKGYLGLGMDATGVFLNDLWEYDPVLNSWIQKANFPSTGRFAAIAFSVGTRGYVGTGYDQNSISYDDLWEYYPLTNTWTAKANFPGGIRAAAVAFSIGTKGYVGLGQDTIKKYNDLWEYNPATNIWIQKSNYPGNPCVYALGITISGKGYVGTGADTSFYDDWHEFNSTTNSWAAMTNFPGGARFHMVGFGLGCRGYIGTGHYTLNGNPSDTNTVRTNDWWQFAPADVQFATINGAYGSTMNICPGGSATLTASGGIAYVWNTGETSTSLLVSPTTKTTYTVTATSAGFMCVSTATITVVVQPMNISLTEVPIDCSSSSGSATVNVSNSGSPPYTYLWVPSNQTNPTAIGLLPDKIYTVTVWGGPGCIATATVQMTELNAPNAEVSGDTIVCVGDSIKLTGSGGYTYSWSTGAHSVSVFVSPSVTTTYTLVASIGICHDTATKTVKTISTPTAVVTGNTVLCAGTGDAATLSASGGINYIWSNASTATSIVVSPSVSTTYSVTTSNGICNNTASILVNVLPPPVAQIAGNPIICEGFPATLTASGGGTYAWNSGEITPAIHPDSASIYSVVVSIGNCKDSASVNVVLHQLPTANVSADVTIVQGQSTDLSSSGGVTYVWSNSATGQDIIVSPQNTTDYCVTVFDANSCWDTACVNVHVISCETGGELYLPNAFSPNGDGENDMLQIFFGLFDCIKSFNLIIYNRWGEKVYQTSDPKFKWDGIYNQGNLKNTEEANTEVFVYHMEAALGDGRKISKKGNINLIR